MAGLTAQEQALLETLLNKAKEPEPAPTYDTLEKIVRYLVHTSDKFSANPDDRQVMLETLDALITPPAATNAVPAN